MKRYARFALVAIAVLFYVALAAMLVAQPARAADKVVSTRTTDGLFSPLKLVDNGDGTYSNASVLVPDGDMLSAASGNVANASAVATLAGAASKTTYITGFVVTASGATAALVVNGTVTGLIGGTMTFTFAFPAGATVGATPLIVTLSRPIPASATNTSIVVTLPAGGAGNTNAAVTAFGFRR